MPKFIGREARPESTKVEVPPAGAVKLSYAQQKLLPPETVLYVVNTSDRGGAGRLAKRWYNWYVYPHAILNHVQSTVSMRRKAARVVQRNS